MLVELVDGFIVKSFDNHGLVDAVDLMMAWAQYNGSDSLVVLVHAEKAARANDWLNLSWVIRAVAWMAIRKGIHTDENGILAESRN